MPISSSLFIVNDGVQLMNFLTSREDNFPDVLFLDLNMPRKSGYECLEEIKLSERLKNLPVIIFSTSLNLELVDLLYHKGAQYYIRKPGDYDKLKKIILEAITSISQKDVTQPSRDKFILQS